MPHPSAPVTGVPTEEVAAAGPAAASPGRTPVPPAPGTPGEPAPARPHHRGRPAALVAAVTALAVGMVLVGGILTDQDGPGEAPATGPVAAGRPGASAAGARAGGDLTALIAAQEQRLADRPGDAAGWGRLGAAYVEQARVTGDPAGYPRAEEALRRAGAAGGATDASVLAAHGALANARHDFAAARDWGRRALARNSHHPAAHGVLVDALTQLGDAKAATAAAQAMLNQRPDVASYTRASYELELHGDLAGARTALERALAAAANPADIAFCRQYLAELALATGKPAEALTHVTAGLAADRSSTALVAVRAKAQAAAGRTDAALRDYADVTARLPLPHYLLEHAELTQAAGRTAEAKQRYALVLGQQQLFEASGVVDDLFRAEYEADHGSPAAAVKHARAEWARRKHVDVADALSWALYRSGQHAEALRFAAAAAALGTRSARFAYHRGMIEAALGRRAEARRSLTTALALNPAFSPLHAPRARAALAGLGGA